MLMLNALLGIHSHLYIMAHQLVYSDLIYDIYACSRKPALPKCCWFTVSRAHDFIGLFSCVMQRIIRECVVVSA